MVEGPDVSIATIEIHDLPNGWQTDLTITRDLGTQWMEQNSAVLLRIPSAIVPHTANFILNPRHADALEFKIVEGIAYPFDLRIKQ
jgi:RES domain-containing protein